MNAGAFVCPLIGVALSGRIGLSAALMIGGGARLVGAMLFYLYPIKGERPNLLHVWRDALIALCPRRSLRPLHRLWRR